MEGSESTGEGRARGKWILRMHRLSGMIPRANRYYLPHRKADAAYSVASPVGTCLFVRVSGKMDFLGRAPRGPFFRGVHSSPGRRPPSTSDANAAHHHFRVSPNYKEIRLSRSVREQVYCIVTVDCSKQPNVYC